MMRSKMIKSRDFENIISLRAFESNLIKFFHKYIIPKTYMKKKFFFFFFVIFNSNHVLLPFDFFLVNVLISINVRFLILFEKGKHFFFYIYKIIKFIEK